MFNEFSWWHVAYLLITTHITIVTVTVYLHRAVAHRSLTVAKPLEHFFRFWSWLTTGQNPKEWAAVHRKHHAFCEKQEDPHSPQTKGIWNVLFKGAFLYKKEANNPETIKRYGHMTPDDALHHKLYAKYTFAGLISLAILELLLFGVHGIWIYLGQILWIPFWAAGIINGVGHFKGYRNFDTTDASTNIFPWGIIIGGEELHNNHHAYPTSAKLSFKWYEFDIGWVWINIFKFFGLVEVNKVVHLPKVETSPVSVEQSVEALLGNKAFVLKMFYKKTKDEVVTLIESVRNANKVLQKVRMKELCNIFYYDNNNPIKLTSRQEHILKHMLENKVLAYLYEKKQELLMFWNNKTATLQQTKENFSNWISSVKSNAQYQNEQIHFALNKFANSLVCLRNS